MPRPKGKAWSPSTPAEARRLLGQHVREKDVQGPAVAYGRALKWDIMVMYNGSQGGGQVYATPGIPDTYWCKAGFAFWIEFKKPDGELRPGQVKRIAALRAQGQVVYVVDQPGMIEPLLARYEQKIKARKISQGDALL